MRAWSLTDGDIDLEEECLGVAEAVADRVERRRVAPRALWRLLGVFGSIDPRDAPEGGAGPIAPRGEESWPALIVAAGPTAAPYLARAKAASGGRSLAVYIGARGAPAAADLVVALEQDRFRGPNVAVVAAPPHRVGPVRLAAARGGPAPFGVGAAGVRVGVMLGDGRSLSGEDLARLLAGLTRLSDNGVSLVARPARDASETFRLAMRGVTHYLWDGEGADPYISILAHVEALVVVATSTRVISEALSVGCPVMTFLPAAAPRRVRAFVDTLARRGLIRPFVGRIESYPHAPVDSTRDVAHAIHALAATRAVLRPAAGRTARTRARETNGPAAR